MGEYNICTLAEAGNSSEELTALFDISFSGYPGVLRTSPDYMRWYLTRPGLDGGSSFVATHGGKVVSNVFVTASTMWLGGDLTNVGIVDSVMTHPQHRRKGLARRVMTAAIDFMEREGVEVSLLFTAPGSVPYRFYESLGYREVIRVAYLIRRPQSSQGEGFMAEEVGEEGAPRVREFINSHYYETNGYIPLDDELWHWRKVKRPLCSPANVYTIKRGERIVGTATLCRTDLILRGGNVVRTFVVADAALSPGREGRDAFRALMNAVPRGFPSAMLLDKSNERYIGLCRDEGFSEVFQECGMVRFPGGGRRKLPRGEWYVPSESTVGV
ncbi:MAG: GNAT family N-acetyltransferase [bacterium]